MNKTEVDGGNVEIDDNSFLNIELKIVEEDETVKETVVLVENELKIEENTKEDNKPKENNKPKEDNQPKEDEKISKYEEDDLELSEFIVRKDSLRRSIGDMKYVMEKLKSEESKAKDTNLFTKVDIITYKRHQSITEDNCKNKEDTVENKITINRNVSQTDNNESNDIKTVKCKLLNETNEKYKINGEAQKSKDVELEIVEIRTNGTEKKPTSNPNGRVSAMKLIFDSPSPDEKISPNSMNFPNPLPKPRRTKFLKSSSSDESTVSESSISSPTKFKENLI